MSSARAHPIEEAEKTPEEFNPDAVRLFGERGEGLAREIAECLGVAESPLCQWRNNHGQVAEGRPNHRGESGEEEPKRLRHDNVQLTKERDLLKIAFVYFAYFVKDGKRAWSMPSLRPQLSSRLNGLCELFGVSHSGDYAPGHRPDSPRVQFDDRRRVKVRVTFKCFRGISGSPRITRELKSLVARAHPPQ